MFQIYIVIHIPKSKLTMSKTAPYVLEVNLKIIETTSPAIVAEVPGEAVLADAIEAAVQL